MNNTRNTSKKSKNEIDPRFIKTIDGKEFVLYNGLLNAAHENGLKSLEVDVLQYPTAENGNTVICIANASDNDGRVFAEIADANISNVDEKMQPHFIRIAATRAKARVLRDFNNVAMTCLEELGNAIDSETDKTSPVRGESNQKPSSEVKQQKPIQLPQQNEQPCESNSDQTVSKISPAQKNAIENLAQRNKMDVGEMNKLAMDTYGKSVDELSSLDAANMIRLLQKSA